MSRSPSLLRGVRTALARPFLALLTGVLLVLGSVGLAAPAGALPAATVGVVSSPVTTATYGTSVTFTATIAAVDQATKTTVAFAYSTDGGATYPTTISGCAAVVVGSGTVNVQVQCITSALPVGVDHVQATYGGDVNTAAGSGNVAFSVTQATALPTVSALPATPVAVGTSVTITGVVPHSSAVGVIAPTGTMTFTFSTDGTNFTAVPSCTGVSAAGGTATCVTTQLPSGTTHLKVSYINGGDVRYASGTSTSYAYSVQKVSTVVVTTNTGTPVSFGTSVVLTATVGAGQTGNVDFLYSTNGSTYSTLSGCTGRNISLSVATCTTTTLPVGTVDLEANYLGDGVYIPVTSPALPFSVTGTGASTITLLASPASPVATGTSVVMTATVGAGQSGTVTFKSSPDNSTYTAVPACTAIAISGTTATCTSTAVPVGTKDLEAVYSGNGSFASAVSAALPYVVAGSATSTVAITAAPASPVAALALVTLTATVGLGETGTVAFQYSSDGVTFITVVGCATQAITAVTASCSTTGLPAGIIAVRAVYSGSATYAPSTSTSLSYFVVGSGASTITLGASPVTPGAPGSSVTITATLGAGQTGFVGFQYSFDGLTYTTITACANVAVLGTSAACTTTTLPAGTSNLKAVYFGNATKGAVTSAAYPYSVEKVTGSVNIATSPSGSTRYGTLVTLTVTVGTGETGFVAFQSSKNGSSFSYVPGCASRAIAGVTAACATTGLPANTKWVRAVYSGDGAYAPNVSAAVALAVKPVPASTTFSSFSGSSRSLSATMKLQIRTFAAVVKSNFDATVTVRAFAKLSTTAASRTLSVQRANAVAAYLRSVLQSIGATGVKVTAVGGGVRGRTTATSNVVFAAAS